MNLDNWLKDTVVYEVYPQSFYDSNGDGIGDLLGIIEKMDYIQEMGFTAIWLNPINPSSFRDGGYDVTDFYGVDQRYGTVENYKTLCKEAHARGMRVICDIVAGHTSVDHPWFVESARSEKNEYTNRYIWTDATFGSGDGIAGYGERDGNFIHNFFWCQPALNYGYAHPDPQKPWQLPPNHPDCIATREELKRILKYWIDLGTDGFRIDMAHSLIKGDVDKTAAVELWQDVRRYVESINSNCLLIAEWGSPANAIKAGFHLDFLLHSNNSAYTSLFRYEKGRNTTNAYVGHSYFNKDGLGDINDYLNRFLYDMEQISDKGYIGQITGNHDIPRLSYMRSLEDIKAAMVFLFTMPGVPFVYYGDEIGMKYIPNMKSKEGGYNRTGSRTPMQWNEEKNHGFSISDEPYLPTDDSDDAPTVEKQINDKNSLLNHVKQLIRLHSENPALWANGGFKILNAGYPFIFERFCEGREVFVTINPSARTVNCTLPDGYGTIMSMNAEIMGGAVILNGVGYVIAERRI